MLVAVSQKSEKERTQMGIEGKCQTTNLKILREKKTISEDLRSKLGQDWNSVVNSIVMQSLAKGGEITATHSQNTVGT